VEFKVRCENRFIQRAMSLPHQNYGIENIGIKAEFERQ